MSTRIIFRGLERSRRDVHCSPLSSAKVKNKWSYTSAPHLCLHGVHGDNCTLLAVCVYIRRCVRSWRVLAETCSKNVILWNVELCIRRKHAYQRTLMVVLRGRQSARELQFFRITEGGNATSVLRHNCYVTRRRCAMSGPSDSESCQFFAHKQ